MKSKALTMKYVDKLLAKLQPFEEDLVLETNIHKQCCVVCAIKSFDLRTSRGQKLNLTTGEFYYA